MPPDKIQPFHDPRISLRSALLNGLTYGYLFSPASSSAPKRGTIVLIHGFPDISFGWRYQIPLLTSLGLDVIALDCIGYGRSDSPPSSHLSSYTMKRIADDVATLCSQLSLSSIILGGHDWGGAIVYRVQQFHPTLIRAFFAVCTPYGAPTPKYEPLPLLVAKVVPNFAYQLHFASGECETAVQSPLEIQQFLHGLYGGRTPEGKVAFIAEKGVLTHHLPHIRPSKLLTADEMAHYVAEYSRHGMNGPLNWYRTRELNWLDDYAFFYDNGKSIPGKGTDNERTKVTGCEVLFVQATKDQALPPAMARRMADQIERLTWEKVDAGHWCLWERAEECNAIIERWLKEKVFTDGRGSGQGEVKGKGKGKRSGKSKL